MAACSLVQLYRVSPEEALFRIQAAFDTRGDLGARSPETTQQVQFVREYAQTY